MFQAKSSCASSVLPDAAFNSSSANLPPTAEEPQGFAGSNEVQELEDDHIQDAMDDRKGERDFHAGYVAVLLRI
jgi:hypothetical protein